MAKTFFGRLIQAVLDAFRAGFPGFVKRNYNKIPAEIRDRLSLIIEVVERIKQFIDSPIADAISDIIPGHADDNFKDWLRFILPIILENYKDISNSDAHTIATQLTQELTGMSYGQSAITIETVYQVERKV